MKPCDSKNENAKFLIFSLSFSCSSPYVFLYITALPAKAPRKNYAENGANIRNAKKML